MAQARRGLENGKSAVSHSHRHLQTMPVNLANAMNTTASQTGSIAVSVIEKQLVDWLVAKDERTGEHSLIRFKFACDPVSEVLSHDQPPRVVEFFRGEGDAKISVGSVILTTLQLKRGIWAKAKCDGSSEILRRWRKLSAPILNDVHKLTRDKTVLCEVIVGRDEVAPANIEEIFLFAYLPPEVASFQDEQARLKRLAEWVLDLLDHEGQEQLEKVKTAGNMRAEEQLKNFPRRLVDHESAEIDHYKNRNDVIVKLLRKEWPRFFEAMDNLKLAKMETARVDCQKRILIAYLADNKALNGCHSKVKLEEAANLSQNDDYLRLMNQAMDAPKCRVPKIDWQLVSGWIEKNYYRMNDKALEIAFNRDWNYTPARKGNTLAKRAHTIGLFSALKRGRRSTSLLPE
jgi:hypothetical protein